MCQDTTNELIPDHIMIGEIAKEFTCKKHGDIGDSTVHSSVKGFDGNWCLKCYIEMIDKFCEKVLPKDRK